MPLSMPGNDVDMRECLWHMRVSLADGVMSQALAQNFTMHHYGCVAIFDNEKLYTYIEKEVASVALKSSGAARQKSLGWNLV